MSSPRPDRLTTSPEAESPRGSPPAHATPTSPTPQGRISRLIAEVVARRERGEVLPDERVARENPDLMPALGRELESLRRTQQALLAAKRAGPISRPLRAVEVGRIDDPIGERREQVALPLPAVLGYQFVRELDKGGQGVVFQAVQVSTGRPVAVKVLPGGPLAGSERRARFDREAQVLASLDHPNVVGILDRGNTADGSLYLVMQYVDGVPLDEYAAASRATDPAFPRALLRAFVQVALAVQAAHERGVVHRDLKHSNVLVDARGNPHVLDFGLARLQLPDTGDGLDRDWRRVTVTHAGQLVGSLPFTSPEQASGRSGEADARSDVYAMGVCLYECLAGRPPYPRAAGLREALDHVISTPPEPFGDAKDRWKGVDPDALEAVVLRSLSKAPVDRPQSAAALAGELSAVLEGRAVPGPHPRQPPARPDRAERRGPAWYVALLVVAIAGSGLLYTWRPWGRAPTGVAFELPTQVNSAGMRLVRIPSGTTLIGTTSDRAARRPGDERWHRVRLGSDFWMATREVTRAQYRQVTGGSPPAEGGEASDDRPVTGVTWDEAVRFCERLGALENCTYRLPTEAEWEYACQDGGSGEWSGNGVPDNMGWSVENSGRQLQATAGKQSNRRGLFDMHGNAAEWCLDDYSRDYARQEVDPLFQGVPELRVVRGGSYLTNADDCRTAARDAAPPLERRPDLGFRVVREAAGANSVRRK